MPPLTESDHLPDYHADAGELAPRVVRRHEFLVDLARFASVTPSGRTRRTPIRCRKRPQHRACQGLLEVRLRDLPSQVDWQCPACNAAGRISGWEETLADLRGGSARTAGAMSADAAATVPTQRVAISLTAHEALRNAAREDPIFNDLAFSAELDDTEQTWLLVPLGMVGHYVGQLLHRAIEASGTRQGERLATLAHLIAQVSDERDGPDGFAELEFDGAEILIDALLGLQDVKPAEFIPAIAPRPKPRRKTRRRQKPETYQLKVTLRDVKPPIWRRLLVPGDISLPDLHQVLQQAMGWHDCHLHAFQVEDQCYTQQEFGIEFSEDSADLTLADIAPDKNSRFDYEYDFGDCWRHLVVVEEILPEACVAVRCIKGRRACPPEDSGGAHGYARLLDILGDPKDEDHAELTDWIGGPFDPEAFDLAVVDARVGMVKVHAASRTQR